MKIWEKFEEQCTNYLNKSFGQYATFFNQGGSDSTAPDILVKTNIGKSFYIEVKHSPAQCGQFVLIPDLYRRNFQYSSQNINCINNYSKIIIEFMNKDFDSFREAGTTGKEIKMQNSSETFINWIILTYKEKGTYFFITNDFTIVPIDQFGDYFEVTAKYRIKRSGSSNVGKNRIQLISDYINTHDYLTTNIHTIGNRLFVSSSRDLHNQRFIINGIEFMFSLREKEYEIRKLSNTYNANVIFSIKKKFVKGISNESFINFLK